MADDSEIVPRDVKEVAVNSFTMNQAVEAEGWRQVELWMQSVSGGRYTPLFDNDEAQRNGYDGLATIRGPELRWELKCEREDKHGNFFFETWSNKDYRRRKPGWMKTCRADWLLYYFIGPGDLYVIEFKPLWEWFFGVPPHPPAWWSYPERRQWRHDQLNKTFGHPVPFEVVARDVGFYHTRRDPATGRFSGVADTRKAVG